MRHNQGLIQRYQQELQARHDAQRTIDTYVNWLRRFLRFHQLRHPREMGSEETQAVLDRLVGVEALVAGVLYGGGLRLMEALRLRVHDVDFQRRQITVRQGKSRKDRRAMLPTKGGEKLRARLVEVRRVHRQDLAEGYGRVCLPHALERKYPHAHSGMGKPSLGSQFDSKGGSKGGAGLRNRQASLERGQDIRTIQERMGHKDINTTMIYTHVLNRGPLGVPSPADLL